MDQVSTSGTEDVAVSKRDKIHAFRRTYSLVKIDKQ